MAFDSKLFMRVLSPRVMNKAMQTFDRATMVVVGVCWAAAVLMMAFAVYTMTLSLAAKHASEAALTAEPVLPKVVHKGIEQKSVQALLDRLQHRYPEIAFSLQGQNLTVTAIDGSKFRQWLTALSYIDTISPEYHWSIQQLCVGKCKGELMRAVLAGEKISFEAPQP